MLTCVVLSFGVMDGRENVNVTIVLVQDVNALWAGLGYYRRARMLHAGAKYVVEKYGGELPSTVDQLLLIPGIGPYTAGS